MFYDKLKEFQPYEVIASEKVEKLFDVKIISFNNDCRYDFIDNNGHKYEVKTEPTSKRTGNYFIEYQGYGKPSGISTTEAKYYIFSDTINYYIIKTKKLKLLVAQHGRVCKTKDNLTYGHLVRTDIINGMASQL